LTIPWIFASDAAGAIRWKCGCQTSRSWSYSPSIPPVTGPLTPARDSCWRSMSRSCFGDICAKPSTPTAKLTGISVQNLKSESSGHSLSCCSPNHRRNLPMQTGQLGRRQGLDSKLSLFLGLAIRFKPGLQSAKILIRMRHFTKEWVEWVLHDSFSPWRFLETRWCTTLRASSRH